MTRISSRDIATQFAENPKLTKSKRFYVYNAIGKRKCRVLGLTIVNGEQKLELVYFFIKGNNSKFSNPLLPINDVPMFEEIEDIGDEDDVEIDDENNKNFGGYNKSKKVKKKRTNKKRTNKKRTNKKEKRIRKNYRT
jgi:hypothetical protein